MLFKLTGENQVVTRYKVSIIAIFIAIMLLALSIASYRYTQELNLFEQRELNDLVEQGKKLDNQLEKTAQSTAAMRDFANYYLNHPNELSATYPELKQNGERYYLNKKRRDVLLHRQQLSANITGIGDIKSFDQELKQELSIANALTPAFITIQESNPVTNWLYYVSLNRFVSLYPWISRHSWQYSDRMINSHHMEIIKKSSEYYQDFYWSEPYFDTAEKGLNTALGLGVFRGENLVGAMVIDLNLAHLHDSLSQIYTENYHVVLIDKNDNILVHRTNSDEKIDEKMQWQQIIPSSLNGLSYNTLVNQPDTYSTASWLIQKYQLDLNGWLLVKYQSYDSFSQPIFQRFMTTFLLLFLGALALLIVIYLVTRKTFIKPTTEFITHIEHSARGDHGIIRPSAGWHHWFHIVEDIFSQNRSLLQQLKDQNAVLDSRVNEKTRALLEKSEQHQHDYAILRSVMDAIPDYLIFNNPQGSLIGCNLAFEQLINKTESEIFGRKAGELINNELGQTLLNLANKEKQHSDTNGRFQVVKTVDNTYEVFTTEFLNQAGDSLGTIDIIRDVTAQYAINAALASAKDQAVQANQAKNQFLANMSHEIRTPINAIQGMCFLLNNTGLSSQQQQFLENTESASVSLLHLVDELLDLAKIESGNMSIIKQSYSLDKIIDQAIKLNIGTINQKALSLIIDIDENVPRFVFTDELRLVQVLTNLINNSVKFTHQGKVSLQVEVVKDTNVKRTNTETLVCFTITDDGIGIAKDKQARLFEAFVQADESMTREFGGSGLGLSICQKIVNLLGGEIKLKSELGKGSEFSFILPFKTTPSNSFDFDSKVRISAFEYDLPKKFISLLSSYQYSYQKISTLIDLSSNEEQILFIGIESINQEVCQQLATYTQQGKFLVAICPNSIGKDEQKSYALLDEYEIPYVVCELPLYRYRLFLLLVAMKKITKENESLPVHSPFPQNLKGVNVLLVEDNLVNQLVAKELLKTMQAEVYIAEHGQQAIDYLDKQSCDVVLMDIQMPVMDGLAATKHIRADGRFNELPIIAMTAHARQEDKDNSLAVGMNKHIAKPVKAELLLSTILSVLPKT